MKGSIIFIVLLLVLASHYAAGFSENARYGLGTVSDLVSDGTNMYYFEAEKEIMSTTWLPDTRIKVDDGKTIRNLSDELFIYPSELKQDRDHLYFAVLSEKCVGQIICDYQDLIKISKNDQSITILAKDLRSAIHISLESDSIYVSESNGKIWQVGLDDSIGKIWEVSLDDSKRLVTQANEIIMDITSKDGVIYWIEEISDQNNNILTIDQGYSPKVIAKNLAIPYDLTVQNDRLYWNEIYVKTTKGAFAEFTAIKSYSGDKVETLMEFQNTSPTSKILNEAHYGPYLVFDDYLFLVNNTNNDSVIHMMNMYNSTKYDIGVISDYDAKYLRTDGDSLFVIGKNKDGFVIDKYPIPIKVPEFPTMLLAVMSLSFMSIFILQRFWCN